MAVTVAFGAILYVLHRIGERNRNNRQEEPETNPESRQGTQDACCGMHITCERDSLLQGVSTEIIYYDDEELDAYSGIAAESYSDAEIEQFRDVLLTLRPDDIAGWARSLQLRNITLPGIVKEEMLLLIREEREQRTSGSLK